jgi:DNA-directed RNA polymerase specialized sigma24 family protein
MSHKDIKALSDAYLSMYSELVQEETEGQDQLNEAAEMEKTVKDALDKMPSKEKAELMKAYAKNPKAVTDILFSMMQKSAK